MGTDHGRLARLGQSQLLEIPLHRRSAQPGPGTCWMEVAMTLATEKKFSQPALGTVQEEVKGIQQPQFCPVGVHHKNTKGTVGCRTEHLGVLLGADVITGQRER